MAVLLAVYSLELVTSKGHRTTKIIVINENGEKEKENIQNHNKKTNRKLRKIKKLIAENQQKYMNEKEKDY